MEDYYYGGGTPGFFIAIERPDGATLNDFKTNIAPKYFSLNPPPYFSNNTTIGNDWIDIRYFTFPTTYPNYINAYCYTIYIDISGGYSLESLDPEDFALARTNSPTVTDYWKYTATSESTLSNGYMQVPVLLFTTTTYTPFVQKIDIYIDNVRTTSASLIYNEIKNLSVKATYSDGGVRDVTTDASISFDSSIVNIV